MEGAIKMEREINYIRQPKGSGLCGQSCLAMILGVSLERAIELIGHASKRGSKFSEHRKVLIEQGYKLGEVTKADNRKKYELPDFAYVRIAFGSRKTGHAVLHYKGKFYDPGKQVFDSKEEMLSTYKHVKGKIQWYFEIIEEGNAIEDKSENLMVAGEEQYKALIEFQMEGKGARQIEKVLTGEELNRLKKSEKFTVISYQKN